MFHLRLASPYLPDQDYSDYLVTQYQDITDVCNVPMPDLVIRAPPNYENAPMITNGTSVSNGTIATNGTIAANGTCSGQAIQSIISQKGCNEISQRYSVTTGDLQATIGNDACTLTYPICVPAECCLKQVPSGATW